MNTKLVLNFLGRILLYFSAIFIFPILVALYYRELYIPFAVPAIISVFFGLILMMLKPEGDILRYEEGLAIVGLGWLFVSLVGSIPFALMGVPPLDAFFESMSGFTTTGATIFNAVETLPKSILFWRSLTQWLGGMGIIVLFVAVFPAMAKKGEALFHAEHPGVTLSKLKPRLRDTAVILYGIYLFYTLLEAGLLYILGISAFDAITHAFTTLSTGGFSTHTRSIAYFNNPAIEVLIVLFMLVGGTNFALHYYLLKGRRIYRDPEFKAYISIIILASLLLTAINLNGLGLIDSLRHSIFQSITVITTTGYTTYDFDQWSNGAKAIILMLMFVGGSSGSTAGGMKVIRLYILIRYAILQILKVAEPRTARTVKYGEDVIKKDILDGVAAFFILYVLIFVASTVLISLAGFDLLTSASSVAATIGNFGPAMGLAGAAESYAAFPCYVKLILAINMWVGRLEIFTVLALFIPYFWMKKW
jgi:trk system potassium uptake protein TrkH